MEPRGAQTRSGSRKMAQDSAKEPPRRPNQGNGVTPGLQNGGENLPELVEINFGRCWPPCWSPSFPPEPWMGLLSGSLELSGAVLGHLARSASILCSSWLHCCSILLLLAPSLDHSTNSGFIFLFRGSFFYNLGVVRCSSFVWFCVLFVRLLA